MYSSERKGVQDKLYMTAHHYRLKTHFWHKPCPIVHNVQMRTWFVFMCVNTIRGHYLQQASAPSEVWLSKLLSVSEVRVGSLLGSVGSVDMDDTSLTEEEDDVGWGGLSITAAPVLKEMAVPL